MDASKAGSGGLLRTIPNGPEWGTRDWGSRGREFKSPRPDKGFRTPEDPVQTLKQESRLMSHPGGGGG
jgi:hypothetical protein